MIKKPDTDPQGYVRRAQKVFEALNEFKRFKSRIYKATPGVEEGESYRSKMPKVEDLIACTFADQHFHPIATVLGNRRHNIVKAYAGIFKLIEAFSIGLEQTKWKKEERNDEEELLND